MFGGESADDLDDLWVYDVRTLSWEEAKFADARPCARRFHSSCMVENKIYIFGGCHGKYNCLGDLYSLDIGSLVETGKVSSLQWLKIELEVGVEAVASFVPPILRTNVLPSTRVEYPEA